MDEDSHQVKLCHIKELFKKSPVCVVLHTNSLCPDDCVNLGKVIGIHEEGHDSWDPDFVQTF